MLRKPGESEFRTLNLNEIMGAEAGAKFEMMDASGRVCSLTVAGPSEDGGVLVDLEEIGAAR